MSALRMGELFAGYGGLGQAVAQVLDVELAWVSENEEAPSRILAHHWPDVPNHGDITTVDWSAIEPVDVLTGGFPCQDVSAAGKRRGLGPDTRTGLWSHMAYAIDRLRPRLVVAENVRGLLSAEAHSDVEPCSWCLGDGPASGLRALGAVLGDLADLGYDASWYGLRAADVGAPHGRFRAFVVAWPAADPASDGRHEGRPEPAGLVGGPDAAERGAATADAGSLRRERGSGVRGGRRDSAERIETGDHVGDGAIAWGPYEPAIRRWERLTRPAPAPTEAGRNGAQRLSPRFVEWMQGLPAGHVTEVPGITRNDMLKALGNGVVPQQGAAALRRLFNVDARRAAT